MLHRRFVTQITADVFEIIEIEGSERHPQNWGFEEGYGFVNTREGAWRKARSQDRPVTVYNLDGRIGELGIVFDPDSFEKTCYKVYVAHRQGVYGDVLSFDAWIPGFRQDPEGKHRFCAEALGEYRGALMMYQAMLVAA